MKLIVGLGNPGRKYEQTRHNVGFMVAAKVASLAVADPSKARFEGEFAEGVTPRQSGKSEVAQEKLAILCPHTYMNASGKSVRKACDFYKLESCEVLVICDDVDLAAGRLRVRGSGSAGGQRGLADIIRHLGTDQVSRLRVGIGRPPHGWETADYVLGKFSKQEINTFEQATTDAAHAALDWASGGVAYAMNRYNADPLAKQKKKQNKSQKKNSPQQTAPFPEQGNRGGE
ncbi:MAG: aminoacyl-tRNA hydrolase [Rhodopirellula sp.]|nr:aminoacyl-tRNA hydrolase [Rhodopirellula sp.]OUX49988.1 MAG: aminoacyl-tRNA hydrolase [Rhodopirellula sp. TMED283]